MNRLFFLGFLVFFITTNASAMDLHEGFGKYRFGQTCQELFSAPSFAIERARPVWDAQVQMFNLEYDPAKVAQSPFILHYDKEEKPNFEGIPLGRIFYGCDKDTGRFSLVVLSHDLLNTDQLIRKTTELLGEPTRATMVQTIWSLPDLYVQIDQVFAIIYDRRAGKI